MRITHIDRWQVVVPISPDALNSPEFDPLDEDLAFFWKTPKHIIRVHTDDSGIVGIGETFAPRQQSQRTRKGDAQLFVDAMAHGSASRSNPGERRAILFRYGPMWGRMRFGYEPSPELLGRLTPERRRIILHVEPRRSPS